MENITQTSAKGAKKINQQSVIKATVPGIASAFVAGITRLSTGSDIAAIATGIITAAGVSISLYGKNTVKEGIDLSREINLNNNIYSFD